MHVHVVKQEGLYQNKVSYSLISSCNCKIGYQYCYILVREDLLEVICQYWWHTMMTLQVTMH